jgi:hypothetical protein
VESIEQPCSPTATKSSGSCEHPSLCMEVRIVAVVHSAAVYILTESEHARNCKELLEKYELMSEWCIEVAWHVVSMYQFYSCGFVLSSFRLRWLFRLDSRCQCREFLRSCR